jgi:hypothetical protein
MDISVNIFEHCENSNCFVPPSPQSDSEGSNSSLDLGNDLAGVVLSAGDGSPDLGTTIKCR